MTLRRHRIVDWRVARNPAVFGRIGFDRMRDAGVRQRFFEARFHRVGKGGVFGGAPHVDARFHSRRQKVRALGCVRGKTRPVIRGRRDDAIWIRARRRKRHQSPEAVTGRADSALLHVGLSGEMVEKRVRVGHDVRLGHDSQVFLPKNLELLRIRKDRLRVHRRVWPRPIVEIRQKNEVSVLREPLADLEHGRANADSVHVDEHRRPRATAVRTEDEASADPVARFDVDRLHERARGVQRRKRRVAMSAVSSENPTFGVSSSEAAEKRPET